jgi:hypothetical protein
MKQKQSAFPNKQKQLRAEENFHAVRLFVLSHLPWWFSPLDWFYAVVE